jgi:hypothetical protein
MCRPSSPGEAHDQCKITIHVTACVMSQSCETNWTERVAGHGGWQGSIEKDVKIRKKKFENLLLLSPSSCLPTLYFAVRLLSQHVNK